MNAQVWNVYVMDKTEMVVAATPDHASEIWQDTIGYDDEPLPESAWEVVDPAKNVTIPQHPDLDGEDAYRMRLLGFTIEACEEPMWSFYATGAANLWASFFRGQVICSAEW